MTRNFSPSRDANKKNVALHGLLEASTQRQLAAVSATLIGSPSRVASSQEDMGRAEQFIRSCLGCSESASSNE